jgi:hypothetical protein
MTPLLAVLSAALAVLGIGQFIRDELLDPKYQEYKVVSLLPSWSGRTWIIIAMVFVVIVMLEGSYRALSRRDEKFNRLEEQLQRRLKIEYQEGVAPYYHKLEGDHHETCRIAVLNTGAQAVHNVRVRLVDIQPPIKGCHVSPLRLKLTNHPKEDSFILNPKTPEFVDVVVWSRYRGYSVTHIEERVIGRLEDAQPYELTIEATGDSVPPVSKRFNVSIVRVDERPQLRMEALPDEV